jgi:3-deoxy-D-manno-octulosonic acid (KDO) 8-phosphate synthase
MYPNVSEKTGINPEQIVAWFKRQGMNASWSTGGSRDMAALLARAAVAAGADGLFLEVHPDPDKSLSDGPNSLALADLGDLLTQCLAIKAAVAGG